MTTSYDLTQQIIGYKHKYISKLVRQHLCCQVDSCEKPRSIGVYSNASFEEIQTKTKHKDKQAKTVMPVKLNDADMRIGRPAAYECPTRCLQRSPPAVALCDSVRSASCQGKGVLKNINFALLEPLRHHRGVHHCNNQYSATSP